MPSINSHYAKHGSEGFTAAGVKARWNTYQKAFITTIVGIVLLLLGLALIALQVKLLCHTVQSMEIKAGFGVALYEVCNLYVLALSIYSFISARRILKRLDEPLSPYFQGHYLTFKETCG